MNAKSRFTDEELQALKYVANLADIQIKYNINVHHEMYEKLTSAVATVEKMIQEGK